MRNSDQEIRTAYAECRKLARRHYENFPVASRLVPRDKRDALAAIYAFARGADDFADEPGVPARLERLAEWCQMLRSAISGDEAAASLGESAGLERGSTSVLVFIALA